MPGYGPEHLDGLYLQDGVLVNAEGFPVDEYGYEIPTDGTREGIAGVAMTVIQAGGGSAVFPTELGRVETSTDDNDDEGIIIDEA